MDAAKDNLYEAIETLVSCNEELASAFTLLNTGHTLKQEQISVFLNVVEQQRRTTTQATVRLRQYTDKVNESVAQLKAKKNQLESYKAQMESEIENREQETTDLQKTKEQEIETLKEKIKNLESSESQDQVAELNSKIEQLKQEIQLKQSEDSHHQAQIQAVTQQLNELQTRETWLTEELERLRKEAEEKKNAAKKNRRS